MPVSRVSHTRRTAARPRRGVTLVEMGVVLVIIGLLAGMIIPRIGRGIAQRQLDRVAQQLAVDLQAASQLAGRHRRPVTFRAVGTSGYEVVDKATPTTRYVRRRFDAASGAAATFSGISDLDFFPNGITSATSTRTFTVAVDGRTRRVTVTRVGHVRRIP